MQTLIAVLGWTVCALAALVAGFSLAMFYFTRRDNNYGKELPRSAFWLLTLFLLLAIAVVLELDYSKFHLLWLAPVAALAALAGDYIPRFSLRWYRDFRAERKRTRVDRRLNAYRNRRGYPRVVAKANAAVAAFKSGEEHDLVSLYERGVVHAVAGGNTIRSIEAGLLNCSDSPLKVLVRAGTYFVATGSHQNMVTRQDYWIHLAPSQQQKVEIEATCINAERPIPGLWDRFSGVRMVPTDLASFLTEAKREDAMTIQAGVWTLTDSYSRERVISRLISRDRAGNTWHPITEENCDRAAEILDKLGIAHHLQPLLRTENYDSGTYIGQFRSGKRHGSGKYTWKDGTTFEGDWRDGEPNGLGIKVFTDGARYEGRFDNGREIGGSCTFPDGSRASSLRNANGQWEHTAIPRAEGRTAAASGGSGDTDKYEKLLEGGIAGLTENTSTTRGEIYERARTALLAELRGATPALAESAITQERLTLEMAIRRVEAKAAAASRGDGNTAEFQEWLERGIVGLAENTSKTRAEMYERMRSRFEIELRRTSGTNENSIAQALRSLDAAIQNVEAKAKEPAKTTHL
jgi:hypothetical protein